MFLFSQTPLRLNRQVTHNSLARFRSGSALSSLVTAQGAIASFYLRRPTAPSLSSAKPIAVRKAQPNSKSSGDSSELLNSEPLPRVSSAAPHLVIDLSHRQVSFYQHDGRQKKYRIAIGRAGWETPVGQFRVMDMRQNPTWINPFTGQAIAANDPKNPLGGYWIGFWTDGRNWIGFHGTPNVDSVGTAASHGCIRMYRQDIAELFAQVTPGMPVIVQP